MGLCHRHDGWQLPGISAQDQEDITPGISAQDQEDIVGVRRPCPGTCHAVEPDCDTGSACSPKPTIPDSSAINSNPNPNPVPNPKPTITDSNRNVTFDDPVHRNLDGRHHPDTSVRGRGSVMGRHEPNNNAHCRAAWGHTNLVLGPIAGRHGAI